MFHVIKLGSGLQPIEGSGPEAVVPPSDQDEACWIDLEGFDDPELALLQQRFGFHPLAIKDCARRNSRAKINEYENCAFMILYEMKMGSNGAPQFEELDVFLGNRFLVTVHRKPAASVRDTWKRLAAEAKRSEHGVDYVLYLLLDALLDGTFAVIDQLSDWLLRVENQIVGRSDGTELARLLKLKRAMVAVRRVLAGERDVVTIVLRCSEHPANDRVVLFFRDAYDHLVRAYEQIDVERDLLGNAMDAYMSTVSNRLNVVMKQLTILSAIFLPPTFITSFFGQNFSALPFDNRTVFFLELAACVLVPAAMLYWFYERRWL
jgi:magnesium transporter